MMGEMEGEYQDKILVIDDEAYVCQSIGAFLEDYEYQVLLADNGACGLELVARKRPDLVVLDLRMPGMDGFEVLTRMAEQYPDIPVVVASGTGKISDVVEALHRGAADYILKPIEDLQVLLYAVIKCLGRARLKRENAAYQEHLEEKVRERTAALAQSREQYKAIFEHIGIPAVIVGEDDTIIRANPGFEHLVQMDRAQIEGRKKWIDFMDPRDLTASLEGMERPGNDTFRHETQLTLPDGTKKYVYLCLGEIPGLPRKRILSILDVTEKKWAEGRWKQLEKQLFRSQKMEAIGILAGGVAHDLNNILSPVLGYAAMIMRSSAPGDEIHRRSEKIQKAALRAAELVRQVMFFNRPRMEEEQVIELAPLVGEVLALLKGSIPATIRIVEHIATDCGRVRVSPSHVHQLLMNLCTNAYHAMEARGGVLSVGLSPVCFPSDEPLPHPDLQAGDYLLLEVCDTGCGIPVGLRERIFDPYFTTKEEGRGTGLGLAMVHSIVQACGGEIQVDSRAGEGSRFSVWLPVAPAPKGEGKSQEPPLENILGSGERLLVVDDDRALLGMYREGFELLGYSPKVFSSGTKALSYYEAHSQGIDLVILDQTMPEVTGIQLAERMRAIRRDLPIILCSGHALPVTQEMLEKSGIERYLSKPVGMDVLSREIQCILGGSGEKELSAQRKIPCPSRQKMY